MRAIKSKIDVVDETVKKKVDAVEHKVDAVEHKVDTLMQMIKDMAKAQA